MTWDEQGPKPMKPRIILHGGCGNLTPENLPHSAWLEYKQSLVRILTSTTDLLSKSSTTALDAAVHAVELLQLDPLFNAGHGAVFDRSGHVDLEASVMLSKGSRKRGAAVSMVQHVKSPIGLAREILLRGKEEDGGGAQKHVHISGASVEELAESWGLEMCEESYFWTKKRWEEHQRGLEKEKQGHALRGELDTQYPSSAPQGFAWPDHDPTWDAIDFFPQGTVGCVVLDNLGTLCVATSTGGITNKLPGRIGDTPSFGAGFWAEEWQEQRHADASTVAPYASNMQALPLVNTISELTTPLSNLVTSCIPTSRAPAVSQPSSSSSTGTSVHGVAMSGTGNGDSFLQLAVTRTCAARSQFGKTSLSEAVTWMAGRNGQLQRSAGDRWHKSGEGEGGLIGIEVVDGVGKVVWDFNCGGMFRAWVDDHGDIRVGVLRETERPD